MQETQVQSLGWEDPLEKGLATQSSILAWKIPWTEGPGGLQSMGSQRVRHDWLTRPLSLHILEIYTPKHQRGLDWEELSGHPARAHSHPISIREPFNNHLIQYLFRTYFFVVYRLLSPRARRENADLYAFLPSPHPPQLKKTRCKLDHFETFVFKFVIWYSKFVIFQALNIAFIWAKIVISALQI